VTEVSDPDDDDRPVLGEADLAGDLVAQEVCDRLVASGVSSILNFAPSVLSVPDHVEVRKVDMSIELQILAFHEQRKVAPRLAEVVNT
jgi:redox-sensing transcriptional repressor